MSGLIMGLLIPDGITRHELRSFMHRSLLLIPLPAAVAPDAPHLDRLWWQGYTSRFPFGAHLRWGKSGGYGVVLCRK
jgi:hypothetical protein